MKIRFVLRSLEFFVLLVLISCFFFSSSEDRESPTLLSATNEFFVDYNFGNSNGDGKEPIDDGVHAPWQTIDDINWTTINNVGGSSIIYVFSDQSGTVDTLSNAIQPSTTYSVEIIAVKDHNDTSYWQDAYGVASPAPYYQVVNAPASDNVIDINGNDYITFKNFYFVGVNSYHTIRLTNNSDHISFENCVIDSLDCAAIYGLTANYLTLTDCTITVNDDYNAIYCYGSDHITMDTCYVQSCNTLTVSLVYFSTCDYLTITDSNIMSNASCSYVLHLTYCENGTLTRNQIHTVDNAPDACSGIVFIDNSTDFAFRTNAIYGHAVYYAVYDDSSNVRFIWNCNTINNFYTSSGADGYRGGRTSGNNVASFRDNIVVSRSTSSATAMHITSVIGYWQPAVNSFDHNDYYSCADWFEINGNYYDIASWTSTTNDQNSYSDDPCLLDGYKLDMSTSPTSVKENGIYISLNDVDIQGYKIPTVNHVSIGCDQDFYVVLTSTAWTITLGTPSTIAGGTVPTPYYGIVNAQCYGDYRVDLDLYTNSDYFCVSYTTVSSTTGIFLIDIAFDPGNDYSVKTAIFNLDYTMQFDPTIVYQDQYILSAQKQ